MTETLVIGIDPGVKTGVAITKDGELVSVYTTTIIGAMRETLLNKEFHKIFVRFEDARKRKWFGNAGREQLQGAGSIKRDCAIWETFLTEYKIPFEAVAPKNNKTKVSADYFKKLTGYKERTSEHGRDAAMLVLNFKPKKVT